MVVEPSLVDRRDTKCFFFIFIKLAAAGSNISRLKKTYMLDEDRLVLQ